MYLLEDIWQLVQSSGPETSAGLVEYINKRLTNKNPVVKQKVRGPALAALLQATAFQAPQQLW